MYQLQYWNERDAEWRGAGFRSEDRSLVVRRMAGAREECDDCVRFRIVSGLLDEPDVLASLSDSEYAQATCPV